MALNSLGLGFVFTAKDLASGAIQKLEGRMNKLEGVSKKTTERIGRGFKLMGVGIQVAGAGLLGLRALGGAVTEARNFGKAIGEVSTLVDEANFPVKTMKNLTMDLAEQFGIDAIRQAPALYQAISAGANTVEKATKLMTTANKFAIGGVTDLTTSVGVLSTAVNVFSSEGLTAKDAADIMFTTIKGGVTTAGELGAALGQVLPIAKSMGISFVEINAAIAATTKNGLKTSSAVVGMKAAIANIITPTKDAEKEASRLGIAFDQTALRTKGLKGFLDSITKSAKFNKSSISKLFKSTESFNFITSLASGNSKSFGEQLNAQKTRAGAADAAFKKMNSTLDQQLKRFDALKKNIKITIGEAIAPLIRIIVTGVTFVLKLFKRLPKSVQKGIAIFFAIAAAAAVVGGSIVALVGVFILLKPALLLVGAAMSVAFLPLIKIALVIAALVIAFLILRKAWRENTFGIRDDVKALWKEVRPIFTQLGELFKEVFGVLKKVFIALKPVIIFFVKVQIALLILWFKALVFIIRVVVAAFKFWRDANIAIFNAVVAALRFLKGIFMEVFEEIMFAIRPVNDFLRDVFQVAVNALSDAWKELGIAMTFVAGKIKSVVMPVFNFLKEVLDAIVKQIKFLINSFGKVFGFIKGVGKAIGKAQTAVGRSIAFGLGGSGTIEPSKDLFRGVGPTPDTGGFGSAADRKKRLGFSAAGGGGVGGAGGAGTTVKSELNATFTVNLDGEKIAQTVKRINADNRSRRSQ